MRSLIWVDQKAEEASSEFAASKDLARIAAWPSFSTGEDQDAADAHEFAAIAGKRWLWYESRGYTVDSLAALRSRILSGEQTECVMFAILKAPTTSAVLGLTLFRRTWCNHLAVDYLAANPQTFGQIRGIGLALTSFVCGVAEHIAAPSIWLETTPSSAKRYKKWFSLTELGDLLIIRKRQYESFLSAQQWA